MSRGERMGLKKYFWEFPKMMKERNPHVQEIYKPEAEQIQGKRFLGTSHLNWWQRQGENIKAAWKDRHSSFVGDTIS